MKFFRAGTSGTSGTITRRILCYGDSLTAGFYDGGHWFQPYGRILADEMAAYGGRCEVVVCGLSGLSAEDMVAKSNSTLVDVCGVAWKGISRVLNEDGPFDLAILMAGTNDLPYPAKRRAAATNIGKLHIACHEVGVPTLALAMPPAPCGSQLWCRDREVLLKQMKKVLANFAHNAMLDYHRMTFFDPAALLNPEDKMLWDSDGLHFSQVGSVVLGKSLAKLVLKLEKPSEGSFSRQIRGKQIPASPISRQQWAMKSTVVKFELPPRVQGWNSSQSSKLSIGRCLKLQCL